MSKTFHTCKREGCKNKVKRANHDYCSPKCAQLDARTSKKPVEQELKDENIELRQIVRAQQSEIKKYRAQASVDDRLVEEILEFIDKNPYRPQLSPPKAKKTSSKDHEMVLVLSDAHYPEVVNPEEAMGLAYGPDICRKRIEYIRDTVVRYKDLRQSAYPVKKLTIAALGDMLGGNIHEELEIHNAFPMSQALVNMAYMLHDMSVSLANEFEDFELIVMPGNHSRLTKIPRAKAKWDNWEFVLGEFIKAMAQNQFTVTVPKALTHVHKVFELKIGMHHGDGIKSNSFAGIPFYGLKQRRDAMQAMLRMLGHNQLDMLLLGHFHTFLYYPGGGCDLFVNGSVKGGDEYSIGTYLQASPPVQGLLTFSASHGLADISRIDLGHIN